MMFDWSEGVAKCVGDCGRSGCFVDLPAAMAAYEITEEAFYWGLGCVPPVAMRGGAYLCGEAHAHTFDGQAIYSMGVEVGKRYYTALLTVKQYNALTRVALEAAIVRGQERLALA